MDKFFLQIYGCQMNQYEAGVVREILEKTGCEVTEDEREADILLMLTCAVRSHAERRALGRLGTFRALAARRAGAVVGVLGCMSQNLRKALVEDRAADLVIGPDEYRRLPELIRQFRADGIPQVATDWTGECYDSIHPRPSHPVCGSVTIMRGCNNYCSYCIVPYTRGREHSKQLSQVLAEVENLAEHGIKDVTLLGQNVLAYRDGDSDFVAVLKAVAGIPGISRIRFLTSHPGDLDGKTLAAMAEIPEVCPALHLPVQSGSDRILQLMKRNYTRSDYLAVVDLARKLLPDLNLTTDIMVGFPSETEEEFEDTFELVRAVRFDFAYMFRFSVRPGTAAVGLAPKVSEAEAGRRLTRLIELQNRITRERNRELVGRSFELLIEGPSPRRNGVLGRTRSNRIVIAHGPHEVGDTVTRTVTRLQGWTPVAEAPKTAAVP